MTQFKSPSWFHSGRSGIALAIVVAVIVLLGFQLFGDSAGGQVGTSLPLETEGQPAGAEQTVRAFPVLINPVTPPEGVATELTEYHGKAVTIACRTCHSIRPANSANRQASDLNEFHQDLKYQHGQLACVACHNAADSYQTLHLADGTAIDYANTMQLCAQCHGTQFRDYQHGSHGGMTGYWDLSRGPRQRNHCVDCHDPHAPAFPVVHPADKPRDRFSPAGKDQHHE